MMMNDDGGGEGVKITENLLTSYVNDPLLSNWRADMKICGVYREQR